jgi:uncharacterized protein (TIGR03435 family)
MRLISGLVFAAAMAGQQAGPTSRPRYDAASVKPCAADIGPGERGGGGGISRGRITLNCQTLSGLMQAAYVGYKDDPSLVYGTPIEGGPGWVQSERYTINAIADGATPEMLEGPMLQALLEDRFRLRIRRDTTAVPIYELTLAKNGPKLTPFQEGSCVPPVITFPPTPAPPGQRYCERGGRPGGPNRVLVQEGITLDQLAREILSGNPLIGLGRRVVDKTGLTGKFTIRLEFAPQPPDPSRPEMVERRRQAGEPTAPVLETALQEQLGLKLEPAKGIGEVLVIENAERPSPD